MTSAEHLTVDSPMRLPHLVEDAEDTEQDLSESLDESVDSDSDDSQEDPTFTEALSGLSWLSVQKKASRGVKSGDKCKGGRRLEEDLGEVDDTDLGDELNEVDQKSFECVETLIRGGKLEKLKIDQCKVYLRKYGLRLTGNKDTLIERIKEHIRILNGGGERQYPPSSFVLNCKGDACMGDVVMFEQRVYEKFDLASRSGPPIGTRVIAGRIVKESYGAAKQQHTFTIEVLWSKGEKPLPPLHPLLIKGRNLYRMKTLRQRWEDETLREQALRDKHSRGEAARTDREMRILEKKMKQELRGKRLPRKNNANKDNAPLNQPSRMTLQLNDNEKHQPMHHNRSTNNPHTVADTRRLPRKNYANKEYAQLSQPFRTTLQLNDNEKHHIIHHNQSTNHSNTVADTRRLPRRNDSNKDHTLLNQPSRMTLQLNDNDEHHPVHHNQSTNHHDTVVDSIRLESRTILEAQRSHFLPQQKSQVTPSMTSIYTHTDRVQGHAHRDNESDYNQHIGSSQIVRSQYLHQYPDKASPRVTGSYHGIARRPLATQNYQRPPTAWENISYPARQPTYSSSSHYAREYHQRQPCRYFAQGRCHFGSSCKFSHD